MNKYHAIGKDAWDALPSVFADPALAETVNDGETFWAYTYMFPHATRENVTCVMHAGVSYSKLTGLFTKYLKASDMKVGKTDD